MNARWSIQPWDWRYRAGFDLDLRAHVQKAAGSLKDARQQQRLLQQLQAFSSFVSLAALCDALEESAVQADAWLDAIDPACLLHLPPRLQSSLEQRVAALGNRLSAPASSRLSQLLHVAARLPFRNRSRELLEAVMGQAMLTHLLQAAQRNGRFEQEPLCAAPRCSTPSGLSVAQQVAQAQSDWRSHPFLVDGLSLPPFALELRAGPGWAEYWPTQLSGEAVDRLVVFQSSGTMDADMLRATLCHELLGHAVFYSFERRHPASGFDHGAVALIEGWATWMEWHAEPTPQARRSREAAVRALPCLDTGDAMSASCQLQELLRRGGHSQAALADALLHFFQYPALAACYSLGALCLEQWLPAMRPAEWLASLTGRAWGDFYFDALA